jgi:hypothetical protein
MLASKHLSFFSPPAIRASLLTSNVQASNILSGVAMSLIKKVDVPRYFAARRAMRLSAVPRATRSHVTEVAGVEAISANENSVKLVEDFSEAQSSSPVIVPPKA